MAEPMNGEARRSGLDMPKVNGLLLRDQAPRYLHCNTRTPCRRQIFDMYNTGLASDDGDGASILG